MINILIHNENNQIWKFKNIFKIYRNDMIIKYIFIIII